MTTKSALLRSLGALALFVLIPFPSSPAEVDPPCATPSIYYEYDAGPTGIRTLMYSAPPYNPIIFYTVNGQNPTHNGATATGNTLIYYGPHYVPQESCITFKALAWKAGYLDSPIATLQVCNLPQ